jgi:NAD-dependent DNA ligase
VTLLEKYIIARWCYAIGEDFISDMEYRGIEDILKKEEPENEYINRSWSDDPCPVELLRKYNMLHLIRNVEFIHKSESIPSINSEEKYKERYFDLSKKTRVSYKIDGWNTQVNYYNGEPISANTRGRSGNFLNADVVMKLVPQKIPIMGKVKVTGEVSIPKNKWKDYQLITGNSAQRNSVATALARKDAEYLSILAFHIQADNKELDIDRYKILTELGFKTPLFMWVDNFYKLEKAINLMGKRDKFYNYLTDGLVIEDGDSQLAVRIRNWEEKCLMSYVIGYTENRGSYGDAIVVDIEPILVDGYRRTKVNVTNLQCIIDNNLKIGSPIAFDIRSAVGCVLNTTKTKELQDKYDGRWEIYKQEIDE